MSATDSSIPKGVSYTALSVETRDYQKCNVTGGIGMLFSGRRQ